MDEIQTEESKLTPSYEELATVTAFIMPYEADIVRSLLESEEIPVFLMDYHTIYIKWFYSIALGGIKVQVHKNDFELAKEIMQSALLEGQHQALEFSEGICPSCNSIKTEPVVFGRRWAVLTWLIVGIPLIWPWIRIRCSDCKNTWRAVNH
jgi:hypothetical protein